MGLFSSIAKVAGPIIGAVTGNPLIGAAITGAGDILGAGDASKDAKQVNAQNYEMQKEFAQNSVRWKVADARAAKMSPIAAMGMQPFNATPSYVSGAQSTFSDLSSMSQNLSRAADSTSTQNERDRSLFDLQLKRASLENELLATQIANAQQAIVQQAGGTPAMPSIGDSGRVIVDPSRRTSTMRGDPATEAAISPASKSFINRDGSVTIWPSADAKSSVEDSWYEYEHMYRNRLKPWLGEKRQALFDWAYDQAVKREKRNPYWK